MKTLTTPTVTSTPAPVTVAAPTVISEDDFILMLANDLKAGQFITIEAKTTVSGVSAKGGFKGATKLATVQFQWGLKYEKKVQKKNEDFKVSSRQWGDNVEDFESKFVSHDGKRYISAVGAKTLSSEYFHADGKKMNDDEVTKMYESGMQASHYAKKAAAALKQGVDEDEVVKFNNYTISNIKAAAFGGKRYIIA